METPVPAVPGRFSMSRIDIRDYLPHQGNWLLVDWISLDIQGRTAESKLALTDIRRPFVFNGHEWAMPGVLLAEFANQTCAVLGGKIMGITAFNRRAGVMLQSLDGVSFSGRVSPGDTLTCRAVVLNRNGRGFSFSADVWNHKKKLVARITGIKGVALGAQ